MNRFARLVFLPAFGLTLAWAQAPAQQPAAQPAAAPAQTAAASQQASVTGCMTQWFGQYSVADSASSKAWQVKGNSTDFSSHENHVVKVQGLPDSKAPSPVLYAQSVQDTGQTCGNAQASNTAQPGATPATGATTGAATTASEQSAPQQQPGGGVAQPVPTSAPSANPTPQATTPQANTPQAGTQQQGGVSGTAAGSTPQAETKGTPEAGSPQQGAVATNAAAADPGGTDQIFNGCLGGVINAYLFKGTDGKLYRLQGNTGNLAAMVNHNVELTGEDFNGKAIQVNGARDLGGNCKAK